MSEIVVSVDYLDRDAIPRTHSVRSEIDGKAVESEMREVTDVITKDGFFLVMEEAHYVFVPPTRVLQVTFDLINSKDDS